MKLNALLVFLGVCYLYADTISGWFPLVFQYPAPSALMAVYAISQFQVAVHGPGRKERRGYGTHHR